MPSESKNRLTIRPFPGGRYLLQGYVMTATGLTQIRKRGTDLGALTQTKEELESAALLLVRANITTQAQRVTWLTEDQLRDAEAATRLAVGRSLAECVMAAKSISGPVTNKPALEALQTWLDTLEAERHFERTIVNNRNRVRRFLKGAKVGTLAEVTPDMIHRFVFRKEISQITQLSEGRAVKAFFNFCVKQEWLRQSPYRVDMKALSKRASAETDPKILSADQCAALLQSACDTGDAENNRMGCMVPFVILSLWCFARTAEILGNEDIDGLKPEDITWDAKPFISIRGHKTGTVRRRTVNIPANVAPLLRACIDQGLWKKGQTPHWNLAIWERLRVGAGLLELGERKHENARRDKVRNDWQAHIMRHTGISYLHRTLGDIREVCRQAGNSEEVAFKHYLTLARDGDAARFYAITAALPAPTQEGQSAAA